MPFRYLLLMMLAISFGVMIPSVSPAQSVWMDRSHPKAISLELMRPFKTGFTVPSFAIFLTARVPAGERRFLLAEMPLVHAAFDRTRDSFTSTTVGNPFIGFEFWQANNIRFLEVGFRLPVAKEYGSSGLSPVYGLVTDFDRFEAFTTQTLTLSGMFNRIHRLPVANDSSGVGTVRFRVGPSILIHTDRGAFKDDNEVLLNYSVLWGGKHRWRRLATAFGLTGRMILTEEGTPAERTIHQFGFSVNFKIGQGRLGAHIRMPLEQGFDPVIGLATWFDL